GGRLAESRRDGLDVACGTVPEESEREVQALRRDDPAAAQIVVLPRDEPSDRLRREPQGAEEAKPFISGHASGGAVACLSRLRDKSAHEMERRGRRPRAHRLAVTREREALRELAVRPGRVQVDEPDRLLLRAPVRARDPRDRDAYVGAEALAHAAR